MNDSRPPRWDSLVTAVRKIGLKPVYVTHEFGPDGDLFWVDLPVGFDTLLRISDVMDGATWAGWRVHTEGFVEDEMGEPVGGDGVVRHAWPVTTDPGQVVAAVREGLKEANRLEPHDEPFQVIAQTMASAAHTSQLDEGGEPYVGHLARVATRFTDPTDVATAWLHTIVEDTDLELEDVEDFFPADVFAAVDALTHRAGEGAESYFSRVKANPVALRVKAACIDDDSDPVRLARFDPATRDLLNAQSVRARLAFGLVG